MAVTRCRAQRTRLASVTLAVLVLVGMLVAAPAAAAATAIACTDAALDQALAAVGDYTFTCGPGPVTVTIQTGKVVTTNVSFDGGGVVVVDGDYTRQVFAVNVGVTLNLSNITL